ncbi:MAG: PVC-type heme-binding CxxCH protein [Opitutaceae bacterium]
MRSYLRAVFPALPDIDDLVQESSARLIHARTAFAPMMFATSLALVAFARADFPAPANSGAPPHLARPALSPAESLASLQLPPGFKATLFAAEPDLQNPIAMAWDAQGRLWVAENYTYAERTLRFDLRFRDRIVVLEDRTGDGHHSSRTVFADDLQRLSSVEIGHGGVWAMCPPQLLFIPDRNGDAVPDGPAEVVLDGFTIPTENFHGFANGLRFGPDGWLYGRCGASAPGELGRPGTPASARIPVRGTLWRYHPRRQVVEVLSSGTTNPWGHDWDERGELFFINTVNGHLWHGITGAHYVRSHTIDPNPRAYRLIDQHADHWHFDTAQDWTKSRDGAANARGGGHAHVGMMIYLGDNWPSAHRGRLYTLNFHGRRANEERLERTGSGFVGRHGPDFLISGDPWFRGQDLAYGPDGGVFVLDWSDTGECHNATGVNRLSGRIYKIVHDAPAPVDPDLTRTSPAELVALHGHRNDWWVRQARLELAGRAAAGAVLGDAVAQLRARVTVPGGPAVDRLRALWTLQAMSATDEAWLLPCLQDPDEAVRTWAVRLLTDTWPLDTVLGQRPARAAGAAAPSEQVLAALIRLAESEPSGLVRLALASTLQRLPVSRRPELARPLLQRAEDAADTHLPLLLWYGLIPVADHDAPALATLAGISALPVTRQLIVRRLAEDLAASPAVLDALLTTARDQSAPYQSDVITGLTEGLRGWRRAPKPASWDAFAASLAASPEAARVRDLNVVFGDGRALDEVRALVLDSQAELSARLAALRTLIENRPPDLRVVCERMLRVRFLNAMAVRGLAQFDDPALGETIARSYPSFHASDRPAVLETLISRPAFARALLAEVAAGRIPRADLTPFHARQIRSLPDPELHDALRKAWGEWREPARDKAAYLARLKSELTPAALATADPSRGRAVFVRLCAACHTLYGTGGTLGPDLTGSGRDNLDYLLDNIIDPGAVVTADFRLSAVRLRDGRVLSGFIVTQTPRTLGLRTLTELVTLERSDIATIETSPQSIMPEGLLEATPSDEVRDLIAYLQHPIQVPLPAP